MTQLQERIISEIKGMDSPNILNQIWEFVQLLNQNAPKKKSNRKALKALSHSISKEDGAEINAIISEEFSAIEGDWT